MDKLKRILAICAVVLLLGLYGSTLVFALMKRPAAGDWLKASIVSTIFVPVFLYACMMIYRYLKHRNDDPNDQFPQKPH